MTTFEKIAILAICGAGYAWYRNREMPSQAELNRGYDEEYQRMIGKKPRVGAKRGQNTRFSSRYLRASS